MLPFFEMGSLSVLLTIILHRFQFHQYKAVHLMYAQQQIVIRENRLASQLIRMQFRLITYLNKTDFGEKVDL